MKAIRPCSFVFWFLPLCTLLALGCTAARDSGPTQELPETLVEKIAVFGFRSVLGADEASRMVRDELSGATYRGEPVPSHIARELSEVLFERLSKEKGMSLVSPGRTGDVFSSMVNSDPTVQQSLGPLLQETGVKLDVDAVLVGHVSRWRDRRGRDFAVNEAASVAFDLHLLRSADGRIIWSSRFDKTQTSLSENLLDFQTFVRSGGRWMRADELAAMGLDELVTRMPIRRPESAEPE